MSKEPFFIDDGPAHHAAFLIGVFLGFVVMLPISIVLSFLTGWWI